MVLLVTIAGFIALTSSIGGGTYVVIQRRKLQRSRQRLISGNAQIRATVRMQHEAYANQVPTLAAEEVDLERGREEIVEGPLHQSQSQCFTPNGVEEPEKAFSENRVSAEDAAAYVRGEGPALKTNEGAEGEASERGEANVRDGPEIGRM